MKIIVLVFCFMLTLIFAAMACMYANSLKFQALFIDYSIRCLNSHQLIFLYIPIFISLWIGLVALVVWQQCCFLSSMPLQYISFPEGYFSIKNINIWGVLNIIEFVWGFQFLKDSFNFCVSGNAVEYYWYKNGKRICLNSFKNLICKHWGSVVAGSFINAFF